VDRGIRGGNQRRDGNVLPLESARRTDGSARIWEGIVRFRRIASALLGASLWVGIAAGPASALPYDDTNPGATACGDGSHTVYVLDAANILSATGVVIGKVELRQSVFCATVWSRVYNLTSASVSVRETLITYDTPNGGGATSHTDTDTLQKKGTAPDSGWSHQFRDRPAFRAKGEILYQGVWRTGQTDRSNSYFQLDGKVPNNPNSCDNTATNKCHRWPTTGTGGPTTVTYAFDLASLGMLGSSPVNDWGQVLGRYTALAGGSPSFSAVPYGDEDYRVFAYNDVNDRAYARTHADFFASGVQYYFSGWTEINKPTTAGTTVWDNLACHEIGHLLGLNDLASVGVQGSLGGCMGNADHFQSPGPDDQLNLPAIYAAPAGS
jgi:hypothetical protein